MEITGQLTATTLDYCLRKEKTFSSQSKKTGPWLDGE